MKKAIIALTLAAIAVPLAIKKHHKHSQIS